MWGPPSYTEWLCLELGTDRYKFKVLNNYFALVKFFYSNIEFKHQVILVVLQDICLNSQPTLLGFI